MPTLELDMSNAKTLAILLAVISALGSASHAEAGPWFGGGHQSIVSCTVICVHGGGGAGVKWWQCKSNLTGQVLSLRPSSRPCFWG